MITHVCLGPQYSVAGWLTLLFLPSDTKMARTCDLTRTRGYMSKVNPCLGIMVFINFVLEWLTSTFSQQSGIYTYVYTLVNNTQAMKDKECQKWLGN